jgi:multisubunit Na+/H+ antiporter MnhG subunit
MELILTNQLMESATPFAVLVSFIVIIGAAILGIIGLNFVSKLIAKSKYKTNIILILIASVCLFILFSERNLGQIFVSIIIVAWITIATNRESNRQGKGENKQDREILDRWWDKEVVATKDNMARMCKRLADMARVGNDDALEDLVKILPERLEEYDLYYKDVLVDIYHSPTASEKAKGIIWSISQKSVFVHYQEIKVRGKVGNPTYSDDGKLIDGDYYEPHTENVPVYKRLSDFFET